MQITIARPDKEYGPYSLEQVNQFLALGQLHPQDWAWFEGSPNWVTLSQVPGVIVPNVDMPSDQSSSNPLLSQHHPSAASAISPPKGLAPPLNSSTRAPYQGPTLFTMISKLGTKAYWLCGSLCCALALFIAFGGLMNLIQTLAFIAFTCVILGWFSPQTFAFLFGSQATKGTVIGSFLGALLLFAFIGGSLTPPSAPAKQKQDNPGSTVLKPTRTNVLSSTTPTASPLRVVETPLNENEILLYPYGPERQTTRSAKRFALKGPVREVIQYKGYKESSTDIDDIDNFDEVQRFSPKGKLIQKITYKRGTQPLRVEDYEYNHQGKLTQITTTNKKGSTSIQFSYKNGQLATKVYNSDIGEMTTTYKYDGNQLSELTVTRENGETIIGEKYKYRDGWLVKNTSNSSGNEATYQYKNNRLITYSYTGKDSNGQPDGQVWHYTYTSNGIVTKFVQELKSFQADLSKNISLFNDRGFLMRFTSYNADGSLSIDSIYSYTYDKHGNWVRKQSVASKKMPQQHRDDPSYITVREITYYSAEELNAATVADETGEVRNYEPLFD